jgi:hypothetical protein
MGGVKGSNTAAHVSENDSQTTTVRLKRRAPVIAVEREAQGRLGEIANGNFRPADMNRAEGVLQERSRQEFARRRAEAPSEPVNKVQRAVRQNE